MESTEINYDCLFRNELRHTFAHLEKKNKNIVGEVEETKHCVTIYIDETIEVIYQKREEHFYLLFNLVLNSKPDDNENYIRLKEKISNLGGRIKEHPFVPQVFQMIEVHSKKNKFNEVIDLVMEFCKKEESDH